MIDQLSDERKSVMLARAMGIKLAPRLEQERDLPDDRILLWILTDGKYNYGSGGASPPGRIIPHRYYNHKDSPAGTWREYAFKQLCLDFYQPANMALAWGVHLWAAYSQEANVSLYYNGWWSVNEVQLAPDAQRLWLDKIMTLLLEAGLIKIESEE